MNRTFKLTVMLIFCFAFLAVHVFGCSSSDKSSSDEDGYIEDNNTEQNISTEESISTEKHSEMEQNSIVEGNSTQDASSGEEKESDAANETELIQYKITEDKLFYIVTGANDEVSKVEIPALYKGLQVIAIEDGAFEGKTCIQKVVLPDTVVRIGKNAFNNCSSLSEIYLTDNITQITNGSFDGTAWYNSQAEGMLYIGNIFYGYKGSLDGELDIPDNTVCIAFGALKGQSPISLKLPFVGATAEGNENRHLGYIFGAETAEAQNEYIPEKLTEITVKSCQYTISDSAFTGCEIAVNIDHSLRDWELAVEAGCNFEGTRYRACSRCEYREEENFVLPHNYSDTWLTDDLYHWHACQNQGCGYKCDEESHLWNSENTCTVCYRYKDTGMEFAFNSDLSEYRVSSYTGTASSVIIPSVCNGYPVTSIDNKAFYGCIGITSITVPSSVTKIGSRAFAGCTGLDSITIPGSVSDIGSYAFYKCINLKSVILADGVKSIGARVFDGCNILESVTIPESITDIGICAFVNCEKLTEITFCGEKESWQNVKKEDPWMDFTYGFSVKCTDGEIFYKEED